VSVQPRFVIGTRKSALALWQSRHIADLLHKAFPEVSIELKEIITKGDLNSSASLPSIGGKGLFTAELEQELLTGTIHFAVHSLKDLPTEMESHFTLGAVSKRTWSGDVLISRGHISFRSLPAGSVVGTSSPRRESQLKRLRPDLTYKDIRGNVDSRIKKVRSGEYDATVLAEAGLRRLSLEKEITEVFSEGDMLPAPGQGALAVQCLSTENDELFLRMLRVIEDDATRLETTAERTFLHELEAGCSTPVAAYAKFAGGTLSLKTACLSSDGCTLIRFDEICEGTLSAGTKLARELARKALDLGFDKLGFSKLNK